MDHPGCGEKGEHSLELVKRKVSVAPIGSVYCSRAVGAGCVAPRRDFNLHPVEPWHPLEFPPSRKTIGKGFSQYSHRHPLHHFLKDILLLQETLYFAGFQDDENTKYLFETHAGDTRVHKPIFCKGSGDSGPEKNMTYRSSSGITGFTYNCSVVRSCQN
jgi:hypothetical protein